MTKLIKKYQALHFFRYYRERDFIMYEFFYNILTAFTIIK